MEMIILLATRKTSLTSGDQIVLIGFITRVNRFARYCEFSNAVAKGHDELWWLKAMDRLYVTPQMLWPLAITNYSNLSQ